MAAPFVRLSQAPDGHFHEIPLDQPQAGLRRNDPFLPKQSLTGGEPSPLPPRRLRVIFSGVAVASLQSFGPLRLGCFRSTLMETDESTIFRLSTIRFSMNRNSVMAIAH
jgi:hypothetical protein